MKLALLLCNPFEFHFVKLLYQQLIIMKTFQKISLVTIIGLMLMSFTVSTSQNWTKLGQKKVNFSADRDVILVGVKDGRFTKLKMVVKGAPITIHKTIVHFGNGTSQTINTRHNFGRNSASRTLDLTGNKRIIKKIVMYHDTKNRARNRATVAVFGR